MRSLKKVVMMALVGAFVFVPMVNANALTEFAYEDWNAPTSYGSATKVDDNITNLKGNDDTDGQNEGPYVAMEKKVADGVEEATYVELNKNQIADRELFEVTVSYKDADKNWSANGTVMTQRVGDKFVLTSGLDPDFRVEVDQDGVYTYKFNATQEEGKTYWQFTLLKNDEVIGTTNKMEVTGAFPCDYITSLWFCNIKVANGVNVYKTLPSEPTEEPAEEPTTPPTEQEKVEDTTENPETSDGILFLGLLAVVGVAGTALTYKRLHN